MINAQACLDFALGEDVRVVFRGSNNKYSNVTLPRDRLKYDDDKGYYLLKNGERILKESVINLSYSEEGCLVLELDQGYIENIHKKWLQELNEKALNGLEISR